MTDATDDTAPAWTLDFANQLGLADVLIETGWLDTPRDVLSFFEKPWKYTPQWALWEASDKPGKDDTNWEWFTVRLETQS